LPSRLKSPMATEEGPVPAAYRRLLSRHLRRVEWFLTHADEPTGAWRAFAAAAA